MPSKKASKTKRKMTDWNRFVMKVKAENPEKSFSDVLKMAGKMKRQGVDVASYVGTKTKKAVNKINKSMKKVAKKVMKKMKGKNNKSKKSKKTMKK
jgi:predicted CopG family antitoxin